MQRRMSGGTPLDGQICGSSHECSFPSVGVSQSMVTPVGASLECQCPCGTMTSRPVDRVRTFDFPSSITVSRDCPARMNSSSSPAPWNSHGGRPRTAHSTSAAVEVEVPYLAVWLRVERREIDLKHLCNRLRVRGHELSLSAPFLLLVSKGRKRTGLRVHGTGPAAGSRSYRRPGNRFRLRRDTANFAGRGTDSPGRRAAGGRGRRAGPAGGRPAGGAGGRAAGGRGRFSPRRPAPAVHAPRPSRRCSRLVR